jgi:hypothetical protein
LGQSASFEQEVHMRRDRSFGIDARGERGDEPTSLETVLLSLDIDGTLEFGDPPGTIALAWVRRALSLGCIVGSASDRVVSDQRRLWDRHGIEIDFVGHKHKLDEVKALFPRTTRWIHIGDGNADEVYARLHGFEFYWVHDVPEEGSEGWIF